MKKIMLFIMAAACLATCKNSFDNIKEYATEENVYPAKYDTLIARVGYNRIELEMFKAGRLLSSEFKLSKAKKTVVEVVGEEQPRVWDSVCSWVNVDGLTQSRMYRFYVYTMDEHGNKSIPVEVAETPFVDTDMDVYDRIPDPKISPSPFSSTLSWLDISSPLMKYTGMEYEYLDKDGELRKGSVPADEDIYFHMMNLQGDTDYTVDVSVRVQPFRGEILVLDTVTFKRTYSTTTNSVEEYKRGLKNLYRRVSSVGWTEGATVFWQPESDPTQIFSIVKYMDYTDPGNPVPAELKVLRNEPVTLLPGIKHGEPVSWYSVYTPFGSADEFETDEQSANTLPVDEDGLLFINRVNWKTIVTLAGQLSTDGTRVPGVPYEDAHIDESTVSYLGMSKKGKENNNIGGGIEPGFIIDMAYRTLFNRLCWVHRNEAESGTNLSGLNFSGIDVWGTDNYLGPHKADHNAHYDGAVNFDPNTQWTFIKRIDFGVDRNGVPTTPNGWVTTIYNPPLKPTLSQWQAHLADLGECTFRYIKVQGWKFNMTNNNKACVSDFRLYYHVEQ